MRNFWLSSVIYFLILRIYILMFFWGTVTILGREFFSQRKSDRHRSWSKSSDSLKRLPPRVDDFPLSGSWDDDPVAFLFSVPCTELFKPKLLLFTSTSFNVARIEHLGILNVLFHLKHDFTLVILLSLHLLLVHFLEETHAQCLLFPSRQNGWFQEWDNLNHCYPWTAHIYQRGPSIF